MINTTKINSTTDENNENLYTVVSYKELPFTWFDEYSILWLHLQIKNPDTGDTANPTLYDKWFKTFPNTDNTKPRYETSRHIHHL